MREATFKEILDAREARAIDQSEMLSKYGKPLISFSMNIAGPVKNSPLIKKAFEEGVRLLDEALERAGSAVIEAKKKDAVTGCELLYAVDIAKTSVAEGVNSDDEANLLKEICVSIEEGSKLGRLFDMDVIDPSGAKVERAVERRCLICGKPGKACASRRVHSVSELQAKTREIIVSYFCEKEAERISGMVTDALMEEVLTTPKPGLVDQNNNGSHTDMDIDTFRASAEALRDYWKRCFLIGCGSADGSSAESQSRLPGGSERESADRSTNGSPEETFLALRKEGMKAEAEMYRATGGVNTHMGAIFLMGTVCGAIGRLWNDRSACSRNKYYKSEENETSAYVEEKECDIIRREITTTGIAEECVKMTSAILEQEPHKGARAEIAAGLPGVTGTGLPVFRELLSKGADRNQAGAGAFIALVARGTDTNMIRRGGPAIAEKAAERAAELFRRDELPDMQLIEELDKQFIEQNLSPGGCADLLAITYFLNDYCG